MSGSAVDDPLASASPTLSSHHGSPRGSPSRLFTWGTGVEPDRIGRVANERVKRLVGQMSLCRRPYARHLPRGIMVSCCVSVPPALRPTPSSGKSRQQQDACACLLCAEETIQQARDHVSSKWVSAAMLSLSWSALASRIDCRSGREALRWKGEQIIDCGVRSRVTFQLCIVAYGAPNWLIESGMLNGSKLVPHTSPSSQFR